MRPETAPAAATDSLPLLGADGHVRPMEEIEATAIRFAIAHYRGRMTEVSRRLGIGRSTLYRKLKDLGLADGPGGRTRRNAGNWRGREVTLTREWPHEALMP